MLYIVITVVLNVIISVLFKLFPRYKIDALQAIVVNYFVCVITGSLFIGQIPFNSVTVHASWVPWALVLGGAFITLFNLIAYNTRTYGITTTTIANKLSLVIPVIFSYVLYREHMGAAKIAGILLALPSVYMTAKQKGDEDTGKSLLFPFLLFVGSGLLDTSLKYVQCSYLATHEEQAIFSIYTFGTAAVIGLCTAIFLAATGRIQLQAKNLLAGIAIGVPNYFSIYFLIRALHCSVLSSSATIPTINISVLVMSTLTALVFFGERANPLRLIGLTLSVAAILLIALGD